MIEPRQGNILEAEAEALVNAVNCVGVVGRGLALEFRKAYPDNFVFYKAACDEKELQPGKVLTFARNTLVSPRNIVRCLLALIILTSAELPIYAQSDKSRAEDGSVFYTQTITLPVQSYRIFPDTLVFLAVTALFGAVVFFVVRHVVASSRAQAAADKQKD